MEKIDEWYLDNLVCPIEETPLEYRDGYLVSESSRRYPVIDGIPVMLVPEVRQTMEQADYLINGTDGALGDSNKYYLETLGISEEEKKGILEANSKRGVDPVVSYIIGATNGYAYKEVVGKLEE